MNNTIDGLIRIKNGYMARRESVVIKNTKINNAICIILKENKYIGNFSLSENKSRLLQVELSYNDNQPTLSQLIIISKPGKRIYTQAKDIKLTLGGIGLSVLSTSKGLLTDKQARKAKLGGELLFSVW